jgi:hypothetical protein
MLKDTLPTVSVKSFFSLGMVPGGVVEAEELRTEELDVFCALELLDRADELDELCRAEDEETAPEMEEEDVTSLSLLYSDAEESSPPPPV